MSNWVSYINGNYKVIINLNNGTKIRDNGSAASFEPSRPESLDVKITNQCDMGCPQCHERSCADGYHAHRDDIIEFFNKLPAYTEVAIGGGNPLCHPDIVEILQFCKDKRLIPSMTVHAKHFMENIELLKMFCDNRLIYGLGISVGGNCSEEFINSVKQFPNAVLHVINGCTFMSKLEQLKHKDLKILILGYKKFGRGANMYNTNKEVIDNRLLEWYDRLPEMVADGWFNTISFDNLAIEQLSPKRIMSAEQWDEFYMGDDGTHTFFVDLVEHTYAKSSTTPKNNRFSMGHNDTIEDMFYLIRERGIYDES